MGQPEERRPYHAGPRSRPGPGSAKRQLITDGRGRGAGPGTPDRGGRPGASTSPGAGIARGAPCRGRRRHAIASSGNPARACSVVSRRGKPEMTSARIIGVAVGNGRFQDELCDALAPLLPIERCRTDRELLALAAQHVLGGAIVGHELLGLDRHVFPALVRNDIPTVLLVLERDIPRRLAALALDGGATRVRILPLGAAPNSIAAALVELRTGAVANLEHTGPYVGEVPRRATLARAQSSRGRVYGFVGPGGTGCTTHVANLLLALGAAEDVVGVDLDPVAPMLVPLLNADPSLGLDGILKAQAAGVSSLERALEANLQPVPQAARAPLPHQLSG